MLRTRWGYALVVLLLLRLGLLAIAQAFPEGGVIVDSRAYLEMASDLKQAGWAGIDQSELHWTPGYPAFLVLAEGLTRTTLVGVGLAQLILTGAAAIALWSIGARLGDARAGMAAAWLYGLSPSAALWSLTIMSESLFAFLLVTALALWVRTLTGGRAIGGLLAGMTLGAAALVRPIGIPLLLLWAILGLKAESPSSRRASRVLRTGLFVVGSVALLGLWLIRNWSVTGRPVFAMVPEDTLVRFNLAYVVAEAEGISRDEAAARLTSTVDSWDDGLAIVRRYPVVFLKQQWLGIRRSITGVESGVWARQLGYGLERQGSLEILSTLLAGEPVQALDRLRSLLQDPETALLTSLAALALLHTAIVYFLDVPGVISVLRRRGMVRAIYVLVILTILLLLVLPGAAGQARFRIPAEPFLALIAGAGASALIEDARRRWTLRSDRGREEGHPASRRSRSEVIAPLIHRHGVAWLPPGVGLRRIERSLMYNSRARG